MRKKLNENFNKLIIFCRRLLPLEQKFEIITIQSFSLKKKILKDVAKSYIYLARAVDEINSLHSFLVILIQNNNKFSVKQISLQMIPVFIISLICEVSIAYYCVRLSINAKEFYDEETIFIILLMTLLFVLPTIVAVVCTSYLISMVIIDIKKIKLNFY